MTDTTTAADAPKTEPPKHPLMVLREQLDTRLPELRNALPPHITPERFARTFLTAIQLNPDLVVANRQTLFNSLMRAANDGLMPDGRQGALVIFNDNNARSRTYKQQIVVWMPMVAGLLTRFRNSGQFKSITANVVREGETFRHWIDETGEHLMHEPGEDETKKIVKAYAMAQTKDGGVLIKCMSAADVERRRAISRAKDGPMWTQWWDEAALKTVLRNLTKLLPSSSDDLERMMERDAELYGFEPAQLPSERKERVTGVLSALDTFGGSPATGEVSATDGPTPSPSQGEDKQDKDKETRKTGARQEQT
jgi:recombination protein RecT